MEFNSGFKGLNLWTVSTPSHSKTSTMSAHAARPYLVCISSLLPENGNWSNSWNIYVFSQAWGKWQVVQYITILLIMPVVLFYFSLFPTWYTVFPSTYDICYPLSSTCSRPHRPIIRRSKLYMQPMVFSPSADVFVVRPLRKDIYRRGEYHRLHV